MPGSVELVREIVDALNRGDVDGMLARMDPDFEWRPLETSVAHLHRGHAAVRNYVEDWLSIFESLRVDLDDPTEVGSKVVAPVRAHGRGRASGVELDTRFCQLWTVRGETAVAMEEHPTREEALSATGQR